MTRHLRFVLLLLPAVGLLDCGVFTGLSGPLDGSWQVDSIPSPLTPLNMALRQIGTQVTGTGGAMGVDAPVPVTVTGTNLGDAVSLTFFVENGSGGNVQYTATLEAPNHLVGSAVFNHLFTPTSIERYPLTFTKR